LSVKFSPDGSLLTYLFPDASGVRNVFAVDLTSTPSGTPSYRPYKLFDASATVAGGGTDSLAEQLRKERMRLFVSGVAAYEWPQKPAPSGPAARRIMLPLHGCILLYTVPPTRPSETDGGGSSGELLRVAYDADAHGGMAAIDPHLSPDGTSVGFVLDDDLYVLHLDAPAGDTKTSLPPRLMPAFRVAVDVVHETMMDGGDRDRNRYQERVIERILTQYQDMSNEDLDYLLDKLGTSIGHAA
jgi:hypothetical protein